MTGACGHTTSNANNYTPTSTCDDGNNRSSRLEEKQVECELTPISKENTIG